MSSRGMRRIVAAAGLAVAAVGLVACGNQTPGGGSSPTVTSPLKPSTAPPSDPSTPDPSDPSTSPTSNPSKPPTSTPTKTVNPTPTKPPTATRLANSMLLTGKDVAKADPRRGWTSTTWTARSICGKSATQGNDVQGRLTRSFSTDLDASGGQWLTRYQSPAAAKAAYEQIVATIKSCKAFVPADTHARQRTENRTLAVGDATAIVRWYDYPKPNDPGSEAGGFPYAVTRKGSVVSVLAFGEMGTGIAPAHWEALARAAAAKLP